MPRLPRAHLIAALAFALAAIAPLPALAQRISGHINYTGALGPVSSSRPLCLCVFADAELEEPLGCLIFSSNGTSYSFQAGTSDYFLIAFLDLDRDEQHQGNEPFEIYQNRASPPADVVRRGDSNIDFDFGDENLPGQPTATVETATATETETATATETASATPTPKVTVTPLPCSGDCDGSRTVTVDEVVALLAIALEGRDLGPCGDSDTDGSGRIEVDEILSAIDHALLGCPASNRQ